MTYTRFTYSIIFLMLGVFCSGPVMRRGDTNKQEINPHEILCFASDDAIKTEREISELSRKRDSALSEIQTQINGLKRKVSGIKPKAKTIKAAEIKMPEDTCYYAPGYYEQK